MGEIHGGPTVNDEIERCPTHNVSMWAKRLEGGSERYCPVCVFGQLAEFRKVNASWARWGEDTVKELQQLQERDRIRAVTVEKLSRALSRKHQELVNARQRLADHESRGSGYTGSAKPLYGYEEVDYRDKTGEPWGEKEERRDREAGENETMYQRRKNSLDARAAIQQEYFRETFAHQLGLYLEWLEKRMTESQTREQA